jgi:frataxin-like iron-binding protein CyaY
MIATSEMTITELEEAITQLNYKITKKYDGVKGICTVTLTSKDGTTVITDANRSSMALWRAYRKAMQFCLDQLKGAR